MASILRKFRKKKEEELSQDPSARRRIFNLSDDRLENNYEIKEFLGKGTFATVRRGVSVNTGQNVAIKIIDKNNIDVKVESLKVEVKILMNIKHENIVNMLDVFEDDEKVYLVMELMQGGELFDKICNDHPSGYSEKMASRLIKKVLDAVKYLHGKGIIHRDLKPENLLFADAGDDSTRIKISDFGLAKIWSGDMLVKTACGSPNYVAPEVLLNEMHGYTFAVDMWSVGVILYVLLCGFCPFFDDNTPALFRAITTGAYSFPSPYWDNISADAKNLLKQLLVVNPKLRLDAEGALNHPWITHNNREEIMPNITRQLQQFKDVRSSCSFKEEGEEED